MHRKSDMSEYIEIVARRHLFAAAPDYFGAQITSLANTSAQLLHFAALPSPTMNRVIGLPGDCALTPATFSIIRKAFAERATAAFWIHAWQSPSHARLRDSLIELGGELRGGWAKFLCRLDAATLPPAQPRTALRVRIARADEAVVSGHIICTSFDMPDRLLPWMSAFTNRPQWRVYLACNASDVPVATGALLIDGRKAWLGMGATLPEARGQGAQLLLLHARLAAARAAGCALAGIETDAAQAGETTSSLNNICRAGFRKLDIRLNYLFNVD